MKTSLGFGRADGLSTRRLGQGAECSNAAVVARIIGYYTLVGAAGLSSIFLH